MDMTTCILCEINYFLCGFQVNMTLCFNCVFKCWSVWFEFSALPFSDCVVLARELTTVEIINSRETGKVLSVLTGMAVFRSVLLKNGKLKFSMFMKQK